MNVLASGKLAASLTPGELGHLLAGLERQKEDLGPIAAELIDILIRAGVDSETANSLTQVKPCSE